ncbi:Hint domain-containing protein [Pseudoruegeria sp. SHC-113]|uniref:Hint domain-containing protein n=1 Tax=Pseudoruegeria sp. SHC-113 TaxID=2855439 RepID=UPI0021BB18EF|nr:Hint domain-containing protein [Pseudoruegeria sp. SHC-113]MCT8159104.1 Hint domain-containing protein [Pseudoruegeria sp. SHC-113]
MALLTIPVGAFATGNITGNPPDSGVLVTGLPISDFVADLGGDPNVARVLLEIDDSDIQLGDVNGDGNPDSYITNGTRPLSFQIDVDGDGIPDFDVRGQNPNDLDIYVGGQEGDNIARFNGTFRIFESGTDTQVGTFPAQNLYISSNGNFPDPGEVKTIVDSGSGTFIIGGEGVFPPPPAICFVAGTMIQTRQGEVAVETLRVGDMVLTRGNSYQPVRWIGTRTLHAHEVKRDRRFRSVTIAAGVLGNDRPLRVSQQHRVLVSGARMELMFGMDEALVPAIALLDDRHVRLDAPETVTYVHILLDHHELVFSNGCFSESIQPGALFLDAQSSRTRAELLEMFPDIFTPGSLENTGALMPVLKRFEARAGLLH